MTRAFSLFSRDCRGTAIVEMALAAPFLAALLIGVVDISRGYSTKLQLEQAAQRTIEKAMQANKLTTFFDTLKAEGAAAAGVDESAVVVEYWLECGGVRQDEYEANCEDPDVTYARYLTVEITKIYTPMFSTRFAGANSNGTYTLKGKAGLRVQ